MTQLDLKRKPGSQAKPSVISLYTGAGGLDLGGQEKIKRLAEELGSENLLVLLGTPTVESTEISGMTVTSGDPTWAGPLAGVGLDLPVYHVIEEGIKEQIPPDAYQRQVGLAEMTFDVEEIKKAVRRVRNGEL